MLLPFKHDADAGFRVALQLVGCSKLQNQCYRETDTTMVTSSDYRQLKAF